ncbi:hypothetical protein DAKH74_046600 [Maudiozyma humilis]|uniref:Uncharacterized protein n=1 Tax=Maudiozyma humilis TaxID=51915 RepID=A0AAV5S2E4_MAUHU|nr:hypothetical protein DAKH74_046600 [Kazachstania humilis]
MVEVKQRGTRGSGETGSQKGVHGFDDKQLGQEREGKWTYASLVQVTGLFEVVRLVQYILVGLIPGSGFDNSTQLLLDMYISEDAQARIFHRHILNKLLPCDSVFFIKGMMSADALPEYEHEFAF